MPAGCTPKESHHNREAALSDGDPLMPPRRVPNANTANSCHFTDSTVPLYQSPRSGSSVLSARTPSESSDHSQIDAAAAPSHERFGLPPFDETTILIFGYGSILWKQNFEYTAVYDTYIKGYTRVFYQGSIDHRGQPGSPGRVVTLLPSADTESRVYGKAFQLPCDKHKVGKILEALDVREGGYHCARVTLFDATCTDCAEATRQQQQHRGVESPLSPYDHDNYPHASEGCTCAERKPVVCLCYIATPENEDYLGEAPLEAMAAQILTSCGLSGPNSEYLFRLSECLQAMCAEDHHVYALDTCARKLQADLDENALRSLCRTTGIQAHS